MENDIWDEMQGWRKIEEERQRLAKKLFDENMKRWMADVELVVNNGRSNINWKNY